MISTNSLHFFVADDKLAGFTVTLHASIDHFSSLRRAARHYKADRRSITSLGELSALVPISVHLEAF